MISEKIINRVLNGSLQNIVSKNIIESMEKTRAESNADKIKYSLVFDDEAIAGEPIFGADFWIKKKGEED